MSNVKYRFSEDGLVAYGELASGQIFVIDADMVEKIRTVKFYLGSKGNGSQYYVIDCKGRTLHDYLFEHRPRLRDTVSPAAWRRTDWYIIL